ncbi:MAG: ROK family protein [Erysipelotrichaceae bacterium]|nr:ROK family protein [Erysipelotrichaceae bacterium]
MIITDGILKNTARIMEYMLRHPQTTRVQIVKDTGLTPAAVTNTMNLLVHKNIIGETGSEVRGTPGSGRSQKLIAFQPDCGFFGGMEINMYGLHLAITDAAGSPLYTAETPLDQIDLSRISEEISSLIKISLEKSGTSSLKGFGFAIPGHYDHQTGRILTNNLNWKHFNLHDIQNHFEFPLWAHNNIECMALSQYLYNRQNAPKRFAFLHIGPGVYCSFFNANKLGDSKNFYLGEIGHMVVERDGTLCECGKKGCLQTYVSESWLLKKAEMARHSNPDSYLAALCPEGKKITLNHIRDAALAGDVFVSRMLDDAIEYLAISMANMFLTHEIEQIYLNSRLFQQEEFKQKLQEKLFPQLEFLSVSHGLKLSVLSFDSCRGAFAGSALASYSCFIKHPEMLFAEELKKS